MTVIIISIVVVVVNFIIAPSIPKSYKQNVDGNEGSYLAKRKYGDDMDSNIKENVHANNKDNLIDDTYDESDNDKIEEDDKEDDSEDVIE